jgi:hypothetical protein
MEEKHTLPRDEKAKQSEGDKHGRLRKSTYQLETRRQAKLGRQAQQRKSTHQLEKRRQGKVRETSTGNQGKARTS